MNFYRDALYICIKKKKILKNLQFFHFGAIEGISFHLSDAILCQSPLGFDASDNTNFLL